MNRKYRSGEKSLRVGAALESPNLSLEQVYSQARALESAIEQSQMYILRMHYFDKSAVAQHALENNHHIGFDEARLIDRATNY